MTGLRILLSIPPLLTAEVMRRLGMRISGVYLGQPRPCGDPECVESSPEDHGMFY